MTRTMYDSVTAIHIPQFARMVAGYLPPSRFAWSPADWARFPNAVKVRIAIFATVNDGHVLDVEPGDATPAQAPGWVKKRRAAGVDPTVYCNASTWPEVRAEFRRQDVPEPHYWIAQYDGVPAMIPGAVAKQYANPPVHDQGHFDVSIVADHWPGVDTPGTTEEDDMWLQEPAKDPGGGRWGWHIMHASQTSDILRKQLAALATAVAADKDMEPAELQLMLDAAVAKNMGEQRTFLEQIVRDVVPDEQAEQIVAKLAERLAAA